MKPRRAALLVLSFCLVLGSSGSSIARQPTPFTQLSDLEFVPVLPSMQEPSSSPPVSPPVSPPYDPVTPRKETVRHPNPTSVAKAVKVINPPPAQHRHSVRGIASWYCKAGVSVCHYRYPPGSMVAAACGKLRAAMGPHWRGKFVTVTRVGGGSVRLQLVDWCGSTTKLIDLYWVVMSKLGGTGVLEVNVAW